METEELERKKQAYFEWREHRIREQEEEERRFKEAEDKYGQILREWKAQCEKVKETRERRLHQCIEERKRSLKDAAMRRHDQAAGECEQIISKQERMKVAAEQTIAELGAWKFIERIQQKRVIRNAQAAIASAKTARETAEDTFKCELRAVQGLLIEETARIRIEVEQKYPLPEKPLIPLEVQKTIQTREYQQFYEYLHNFCSGERLSISEISRIMNQMEPKIRSFSIFAPQDEPLTTQRLAAIMRVLVENGFVSKIIEKRRVCYLIL